MRAIAVNPGPGTGKDHLFVTTTTITHEYDSAANGSGLLNSEFAKGISTGIRQSLAVNGANGVVYFGGNPRRITAVDKTGTKLLSQFENTGASNSQAGANPNVAVDLASGHVLEYDTTSSAREYDPAGSFVAQFGNFTEGLSKSYRVAVDNSCAIHEPPLTGSACEAFDPANGTAYVAFDDTNPSHPPYDVNAFGPLKYSEPPPTTEYELMVKKTGTGSGKVTSSPAGIDCGLTCSKKFAEDTEVTLSASPASGSSFTGWSGSGCSGAGTCKVTMSAAREVTATFALEEVGPVNPTALTIAKTGEGTIVSSPAGINCGSECKAGFE